MLQHFLSRSIVRQKKLFELLDTRTCAAALVGTSGGEGVERLVPGKGMGNWKSFHRGIVISAPRPTRPPLCEFQFTALNFQFTPKIRRFAAKRNYKAIFFELLMSLWRRTAPRFFFTHFDTLSQRFPLFLERFKPLKWLPTPSKSVYIFLINFNLIWGDFSFPLRR